MFNNIGFSIRADLDIKTAIQWELNNLLIKTFEKLHATPSSLSYFVETGDIYGWGWNESGQVGTAQCSGSDEPNLVNNTGIHGENPTSITLTKEDIPKLVFTPSLVETPIDRTFIRIAAGSRHSVALADDGAVYGWGWNGYRQLNVDSTDDQYLIPTLLLKIGGEQTGTNTAVKDIKCFNWSTMLLY